ncbi:ARF GTPase-activating protein GIT2a isoform X7 [Kryptolebias marmoratus]|uniref:ARF GTPase-activating protein GIT2a isoform X7 n=1 Tax=Kryptolebias marmoratus TaxID=37003 RepID=UPI0018ACD0B0|nr:ARF GTPase-activating protein GIT2a isoform X7 [Kryptolebias marmoratus]
MSKRLRNTEVCADCSAPEPRWASVNRGVLICDECCSVHRSLGRHSSQVRHLTRMPWPPTQLQMVQTLYSNGANSIWEHSLLDPSSVMSGKRKPNPQDKLHPTKSEFIRAKYQMLAFVHRMPCREDDSSTAKDLSKQLHSSVRTGNLETCLRLLSLGAQANFFHPEKGNTPLHVAAREGQISQVELLSVYGADPGALDSNGKTPFDHAQEIGHFDLADRLVEIQYELTDRLAFYLYGRKPEHTNNDHFIVPQLADRNISSDLTELAKAAKRKLQSLSNHLFEELAMDVYDEVDRRETDAVWLATQNHSKLVTETTLVPFLPVNPEYSSTRNQGRQKLARFNAHEFVTLVIDILSDAKCRQQGSSAVSPKDNVELILNSTAVRHCSDSQDTDPDYDKVASDDDTDQELPSSKEERTKSLDSDLSDGPITMQEYVDVKNALSASEARIQELMKTQNDLNDQLRLMRIKTERAAFVTSSSLPSFPSTLSWSKDDGSQSSKLEKQISMPESDYDNTFNDFEMDDLGFCRRGRLRSGGWLGEGSSIPELDDLETESDPTLPSTEDVIRKTEQITKNIQELLRAAQDNKHDRSGPDEKSFFFLLSVFVFFVLHSFLQFQTQVHRYSVTISCFYALSISTFYSCQLHSSSCSIHPCSAVPFGFSVLPASRPCEREGVRRLRHSLGCFSTLVPWAEKAPSPLQPLSLRSPDPTSCFIPCSERIHVAVTEMAALFPKKPRSETVRNSLRLLTSSACRLQNECRKAVPSEGGSGPDTQLVTQQVIQCAYDIAKAAKQLVTITTKENTN